MSFLAPLLPALAPIAGQAIGGLLGSKSASTIPTPQVNFTPLNFNAGGLSANFANNGYSVSPSSARSGAVGNLAATFGNQAGDISALRGMVTPGFSALRQSQLGLLQNQRSQALGNLRDNLARRRVLGSSFAQDSLARADQEYQQTQANVIANTYLQELNASSQLIQQQYAAERGQFQTNLDEMNLEADLGAKLTSSATAALTNAAGIQAQLDTNYAKLNAGNASGAGTFWGGIGQKIGAGLGGMMPPYAAASNPLLATMPTSL